MHKEETNNAISIHALRKERDLGRRGASSTPYNFNPRAPQGARLMRSISAESARVFQSTRSARSATAYPICLYLPLSQFQSTRSARSATLTKGYEVVGKTFQSTRSARSATFLPTFVLLRKTFQSTRSARSATGQALNEFEVVFISIHALRKERDSKSGHKRSLLRCIHNGYSPHMCFFLMFTSTNLIQLDF